MASLVFQNTSATTTLEVADLGIYLEPTEDLDLLQNFRDEDILESQDIASAMSGDAKVFLDGSTELSYNDLVCYLTKLTCYDVIDYAYITSEDTNTDVTALELEELTDGSDTTLHNHDNRYYTKTQLQNSGQSQVHWGNITDAPSFGAPSWREPVEFMLNGKGTAAQMNGSTPNEGWSWWNTDDNHIYKYVSGSWVDQGAPTEGYRVIFRDGTGSNDYVYTFTGGSWDAGVAPEDNWAVMVNDDGDGKAAQYLFDDDNAPPNWIKIADVDWYQASFIHVDPTTDLISTNVQSALEELQQEILNIIDGTQDIQHSLDDAYDDGSIISVDSTDVDWQLSDGRQFSISSDSGSTSVLNVSATSSGDEVEVNGNLDVNGGSFEITGNSASNITTSGAPLSIGTTGGGNTSINSSGDLSLKDQYLSSPITLSESGVTGFDPDISATSIIGAINEAYNLAEGSNTLDEVYDGETGTRLIHQDNGTVEWQITDGYEHNFTDAAGDDIISIRALAAGDLVRINGNLDINGGAVEINADAASYMIVDGADLKLQTTTSGDIDVQAAGQLDLDANNLDADFTGAFSVSGGADSEIRVTSGNLDLLTASSGDISITSSGALNFKDQHLSSSLSLSESGETGLDPSYTAISIVGALNELKDDLDDVVVTLDEAYDGSGGSGSGRTITADNGAVVINATNNAPLQLSEQTTAPTTGLAGGQLSVIGDQLYLYDDGRAKWLSVQETKYHWADNVVKGKIMKIGDALGTNVGYKIPSDSTVVAVTANEATGSNRSVQLRRNGTAVSLKTFSLSSGSYTSNTDSIDLDEGDVLQVYVTGGSGPPCKDLVVNVHLKYRK